MWNKQESGEDITSNSLELSKDTDCSPILAIKNKLRDFPSGPIVKTLCFQCKEHRLDPW